MSENVSGEACANNQSTTESTEKMNTDQKPASPPPSCSATEEARCWAMRVGGSRPYLSYWSASSKAEIEKRISEPYQRPVRAVLVPLAEYRRLKRIERQNSREQSPEPREG